MPTRLIVFAGQSNAGNHFDPSFGQTAQNVFRPLLEQLIGATIVVGGSAGGQTWLGGSAVLRASVAPGSAAYWWNDPLDAGLADAPGPCLNDALAWIGAHPNRADLAAIIWVQGEQDCFAIGGNAGLATTTRGDPSEGRATLAAYRNQLPRVFGHLRNALGRPGLPIFIGEFGRIGSSAGSWVADGVRRIQHEVAASLPGVEIASTTRDVGLSDSVHYDAQGYAAVAERLARFVAARLGGGTGRLGPSLVRASLADGATRLDLEVEHDGGTAILAAGAVSGIRVEDDNGVRAPTTFEVAAPTRLTARFPSPLVGRVAIRAGYGGADPGRGYPRDDAAPSLPLRCERRAFGLSPANGVARAWRR